MPFTTNCSRKTRKVLDKRLCQKCYSSHQSSKECTRDNCLLRGQIHDIKLCLSKESATMHNASTLSSTPRNELLQHLSSSNGQRGYKNTLNKSTENNSARESDRARFTQQRSKNESIRIKTQVEKGTLPEIRYDR